MVPVSSNTKHGPIITCPTFRSWRWYTSASHSSWPLNNLIWFIGLASSSKNFISGWLNSPATRASTCSASTNNGWLPIKPNNCLCCSSKLAFIFDRLATSTNRLLSLPKYLMCKRPWYSIFLLAEVWSSFIKNWSASSGFIKSIFKAKSANKSSSSRFSMALSFSFIWSANPIPNADKTPEKGCSNTFLTPSFSATKQACWPPAPPKLTSV